MAAALAGATGCAGDLTPAGSVGDGGGVLSYGDAGIPPPGVDALPAQSDLAAPHPDVATPRPDSAAPQPDAAAPKPDSAAPKPDSGAGGGVGQPCPCTGGALCVEQVCRATCAPPTDPCGAAGNCPADHACVEVSATQAVCVPALQPGAACGQSAPSGFCPVNHVCASVNNGPYLCLAVCNNPNGNCANGSQCMAALAGCSFCAAP